MKKFFLALCAMACSAAFSLEATVISVSGKVELREGGTWVPLSKGERLEGGSVISTGFKSEAVIEVRGSRFTLGPLTRMTVESLLSDGSKDSTQLFIDSGSVKADVAGSGGRRAGFKVRSPVAVASVRGTSFRFTASGRLSVSEGLVAFCPAESSRPQVRASTPAANEAEISASGEPDSASADEGGHAGAFDSSFDVGGSYGVPVAAGQKSVADSSGARSSPAAEKARVAAGPARMTETLAANEALSISASSAPAAAPPAVVTDAPSVSKAGGINLVLEFD